MYNKEITQKKSSTVINTLLDKNKIDITKLATELGTTGVGLLRIVHGNEKLNASQIITLVERYKVNPAYLYIPNVDETDLFIEESGIEEV